MPLELKVNGINCGGCKSSLVTALVGVDGVDEACLDIATKAETGEHPNKVVINAEVDAEKVKAAIATYAALLGPRASLKHTASVVCVAPHTSLVLSSHRRLDAGRGKFTIVD